MDIKKLMAAVALLTASFAAGAATPVKIALTTWIGYSPFYVADGMDMYKKQGLKVTLQTFADPAMLPSAVAGKAVDGALMTFDQVIGAAAQGQVFKVVMPIDYSNGGDAVLADMSINKIADLWEINAWMGGTEREHFQGWKKGIAQGRDASMSSIVHHA